MPESEKQKDGFHTALLNDDFKRAEKILNSLKEEKDFALLHTLFKKVSNKKTLLDTFTGELPTTMSISPSHKCELRCTFCISGFHNKTERSEDEAYLSVKEFRCLLPWLKRIKTITFCGIGETLDAPDLFRYIEIVREEIPHKINIIIVTSGASLNQHLIEKLVKEGIYILTFSLDSPTPLGHGGGKEAYMKEIWKKVEAVQKEKKRHGVQVPYIFINSALTKDNVATLSEHIKNADNHDVHTLQLALMSPMNRDLYKQSLLPTLEASLKEVQDIITPWQNSSLKIQIDVPDTEKPSCWFISDFAGFYRDMEDPDLCCASLHLPHKATSSYSLENYWNSFPMRLLRYSYAHLHKGYLPVNCTECTTLDIKNYAETIKRNLDTPEDDLYEGYAKGVRLKEKEEYQEAKELFLETLSKDGSHATRGRIYLHLCEIALAEENYNEAMEYICKAVYYQFNHRKAFSYLYLLAMLTGKEPKLHG